MNFAGRPLHAIDHDPIGRGVEVRIVADVNHRNQKTEFARHLLPHRAQSPQQAAILVLVDQPDEAISNLDLERLD